MARSPPLREFSYTVYAKYASFRVRGMDGLVVCAMAGARRGGGFEPRFVCPSRGPLVRPPPPPPSASRSTTGTAGATGGVSRPHSFLTEVCHRSVSVIPESATKRHPPPHTCSSALHHRCHLAAPESHLLLVLPLSSPAEGDSNPRLQCGSRLRCRWGTCRKTLLLPHNTQERSAQTEC